MALFTDIEPEQQPRRRGGWIGWSILGTALVGIVIVALVPAPYVIEMPGPVYDTLGTVEVGGEDVELIDINGEDTYPTAGSLDMLTVRIEGSRENLPTWLEVGQAYLDPSKAVLPVDEVFPVGYSLEDSNVQGQIDMQNSQQEAIAAALSDLGYEFDSRLKVAQTQEGAPADGVLEAGDIILSLNGVEYADVTGLRGGIAENGIDQPATMIIERARRGAHRRDHARDERGRPARADRRHHRRRRIRLPGGCRHPARERRRPVRGHDVRARHHRQAHAR